VVVFLGWPNEPVGKVLLTSENDVFGGLLTLPKHEIADCGAFYEVTFFCISSKNLLGDFFYSLNDRTKPPGQGVSKKQVAVPGRLNILLDAITFEIQ